MKILGVDPGIERLGWGLLEKTPQGIKYLSSGVKKTSKNEKESQRLLEIFKFLSNLIKKEGPDVLATEKLFFAKNVKTALVIGEVRGVILTVGALHSLAIREFTPLEAKLAVCGYGKATKESIANMVRLQLNLPKKRYLDDETDAMSLALAAAVIRVFP